MLKSGTSIGANIAEAQNAESRPDFIHKMKIACKELNETHYWLILCNESNNYPPCDYLMDELVEIEKLLNKILGTLKRKEFIKITFKCHLNKFSISKFKSLCNLKDLFFEEVLHKKILFGPKKSKMQ